MPACHPPIKIFRSVNCRSNENWQFMSVTLLHWPPPKSDISYQLNGSLCGRAGIEMDARRWRIIATGLFLGCVGAAVPIAAMSWVSWNIGRQKEQALLDVFASTVLDRVSLTFQSARQSLKSVQHSGLRPCSDAHISFMRDETINSAYVEEIGYFSGERLRCTSWGRSSEAIARQPTDYTTPDGLPVTWQLKPMASQSGEMTAIYLDDYGALINPSRLIDIAVQQSIQIALLTEYGLMVSARNNPDLGLINRLVNKGEFGSHGSIAFSVQKRDGLVAVVIDNNPKNAPHLDELLLLLPVGFLLGGLLAGAAFLFAKRRLAPQAELAIAIKRDELIVHYQPIVELKSSICVGAEALVRWRRPDGTITGPDRFIPLAEEFGLISHITDCVIEKIIEELEDTLVKDRTLHIAINVSATDIQSGRIVDFLDQRLKNSGIRKQQIWLEATERGFIDVRPAKATLERARQMGHSVAIDDFGTGYSSLQHLQGLPLDALKIDKSFVDTINKDAATSTVTLHIIQMAKELGLFTVAEGVENADQAEFLEQNGVDFAQGWLFSKPLSSHDFITYQRTSKGRFGDALEIIQAKRDTDVRGHE